MTMLKQRAVDMISRMPEEKLYYVIQLLESIEGLSDNMTPEQKALKDLHRFRKRSSVEIDYKTELTKARDKKYEGTD